MSTDIVEENGGLNLVEALGNTPPSLVDYLGLENLFLFVSHPLVEPSWGEYLRLLTEGEQLKVELAQKCCGKHKLIITYPKQATAERLRQAVSGSVDGQRIDAVFTIAKAEQGIPPSSTRVPGAKGLGGGRTINVPGDVIYLYSGGPKESDKRLDRELASVTFAKVIVPTCISGCYPDIVKSRFPENENIQPVIYDRIMRDELNNPVGENRPFSSRSAKESVEKLLEALRAKVKQLIDDCEATRKTEGER